MTLNDIRKHLETGGTLVERERDENDKPSGWKQYRRQGQDEINHLLDIVAMRSATGNWIYRLT